MVNANKPARVQAVMPQHVLQRLYDSEIDFEISSSWDCGFAWRLGDGLNGFVEEGRAHTFDEAVSDVAQAAVKHFPGNVFAKAGYGAKVH